MDHSFIQGWQAVDHVFDGTFEEVFHKWK